MTGGAAVAQRWGVNTLVGVALAAIFVPLVLTLYLSVFDETLILFPPKGYTLRWYARILQHEIDHLGGTLYIDRMRSRTFTTSRNAARYAAGTPVPELLAKLGY